MEVLEAAVGEVAGVLRLLAGRDWGVRAGLLDWTCRATGVHIAHDLDAYAHQVAGEVRDGYLPLDLTVRDAATPAQIVTVIEASGLLLARALDGFTGRGWHWGPTDGGGFAALGACELLVHCWDITQGLGVAWEPPPGPSGVVARRLFPGAPADLLWCTGRRPGHRDPEWRYRASTQG